MSLQPRESRPSFHRGSFVDELENARTDLVKKMLDVQPESVQGSPVPSASESVPSLSPATRAASPWTPASTTLSPITPPVSEDVVADNFAFAFDIDGVLIRGGRPIPEAIEAMKVLNGENKYGITV